MGQARKVMDGIAAMLEQQGCEVRRPSRGGGYRIKCPNGQLISIHSSPKSNDRQIQQIRRDVLRNGLDWNL